MDNKERAKCEHEWVDITSRIIFSENKRRIMCLKCDEIELLSLPVSLPYDRSKLDKIFERQFAMGSVLGPVRRSD